MYVKNKTMRKFIASAILGVFAIGILPSVALAAANYSTTLLYIMNLGPSGSGKNTGTSFSTSKSSGEVNDYFQVLAMITNSGTANQPIVSVSLPAGLSYVSNSLQYYVGAGVWANFADDTDFDDPATGEQYPSSFTGLARVRFQIELTQSGSATYQPVFKVDGDGTDSTLLGTVVSPMAKIASATDGDQKVAVTFGNTMSDTGLTTTTNYLLSTNGGATYTVTPTGVVKDNATQVTLTFANGTFSADDNLALRMANLLDAEAVQIENASDGIYQTEDQPATDTTPPSISGAVLFSGNTKLRLTFSEDMTTGDITAANAVAKVTLNNGHSLGGAGLTVNWTDLATMEITLGAGATLAVGDTATIPAAQTVRDSNLNDNSSDISKVITLVVPVVTAPISTAQTLKSGDVSTSTAQTDTYGKIYMVKNGVAVASKADIDTAIAAKNAFLARNNASSNTAYTVTVPASALINDGAYDIIAIDSAENLSNRLNGWLTIDNTGPTVALTYSNNPTAQGTLVITATFGEAVTGTPKIAIDQQGTTDIAATNMTGSGAVWTYSYTVHADNNGTYDDGVATVTITNATDVLGNPNQTATNASFTIDSTLPGVCGSANGSSYSDAPGSNLCSKGTASSVSEGSDGKWHWNCTWGTAVACSAEISSSGGGGGGGVTSSDYSMPSSSLSDKSVELIDRNVQMPKTGDYVGTFTRETVMIHESDTYGDISIVFPKGTQALDTAGDAYKGVVYPPRFLSTASTPANDMGLVAKGSVWLGRKEGNLSFDKNFTLTLPIVEEVRAEAANFSVFYYNEETQSYQNIGGVLNSDNSGISVDFNKFGKFVIFSSQSGDLGSSGVAVADSITGFIDISNHWAKTYIQKLYQRGVVSGKTEDNFDPDASLTRAELAKIALLNFAQEVGEDESVNFKDAAVGAWYVKYINAARRLGVVAGYSDGTFRPNNQVNRAEALKMLISAKGIDISAYTLGDNFYDVDADAWYAPYLAYAYQNGIIEGYKKTIGGGAEGLAVITSDVSGSAVTALQDALFQLGFLSTPSNGVYDSATKVAVAKYQVSRGVISSYLDANAGWFTQATLDKMLTESVGGEQREVRFFYPQNPITRAEAVKIAVTLYELE